MLLQQQNEERRVDLERLRDQFQVDEAKPDLEQIRRQLQSRDKSVKAKAEAALQTLSAQELIQLVTQEQRKRNVRRRWIVRGVCVYVLFILAIMILSHAHGSFGGMFTCITGVVTAAMAFSSVHQSATNALASLDSLESVGTLIENLEIPNPETQNAAREALIRLLPRLKASDSHLLNLEQRRMLLQHLAAPLPAKNREAVLTFKINGLKALEQVGDETFLPLVERLANNNRIDVNSKRLRQAAIECLPALKQRAENERASHQLLRASGPDHTQDAGVLLRPAESAGANRPDELLRPGMAIADGNELSEPIQMH